MSPGFNFLPFQVASSDGRNFVLQESVIYVTQDGSKSYLMPAGATSDGASTPPEIWINFPPFGSYWPAAFLHDCAYRGTLQNTDGTLAMLPKDECDKLLLDAMVACGTHQFTRDAIYDGVALAGQAAASGGPALKFPAAEYRLNPNSEVYFKISDRLTTTERSEIA